MIITKVRLIYHTCSKSQLLNVVLKSKGESIDPNFANGILKVNYRKKIILSNNFKESHDHDYYMKKISNYLFDDIIGVEIRQYLEICDNPKKYKMTDNHISYYQNGTTITLFLKIKSRESIVEKLEKQRNEDKRNLKIIMTKIDLNIMRKR